MNAARVNSINPTEIDLAGVASADSVVTGATDLHISRENVPAFWAQAGKF
jgi:hypothetical protein